MFPIHQQQIRTILIQDLLPVINGVYQAFVVDALLLCEIFDAVSAPYFAFQQGVGHVDRRHPVAPLLAGQFGVLPESFHCTDGREVREIRRRLHPPALTNAR